MLNEWPVAPPTPTRPPNPPAGYAGVYTYVQTVTPYCTNNCVLLVTQALEDEYKTITMKGKSGRFTGRVKGFGTCLDAKGEADGPRLDTTRTWDVKADKAVNGKVEAFNGRMVLQFLQDCEGKSPGDDKATYEVSLRLQS